MATTTLMSFAEFECLEQGADHIELLKGALIRVPPAKLRHNRIAERIFQLLEGALGGGCRAA
jgi:Uma2 family endonuclease